MRPYSVDLREKLLGALDRGEPRSRAAATFGVSLSTLKRYLRQRAATGDLAPRPVPGRPARKGDAPRAWLPARLGAADDATLAEHCAAFAAETGVRVSLATMSRAIASRAPPEDGSPGSGRTRRPSWPSKQRA